MMDKIINRKSLDEVSFSTQQDRRLADLLCDDLVDTSLYQFNTKCGKFKGIKTDTDDKWYQKKYLGRALIEFMKPEWIDYSTKEGVESIVNAILRVIKPALAKHYKKKYTKVRNDGKTTVLDMYFTDKCNGEEVSLAIPLSDYTKPIEITVSVTQTLVYVIYYKYEE